MNKIILVGRLTKNPELIYTSNKGTPITKFSLAVSRPRLDKDKPQEADFVNCVCFGKRAEAIANYVQKGHLFGVSGRLQINKYTDKKDGQTKYSTDVLVEDFDFLQTKNSNANNANTTGNIDAIDYTDVSDDTIPF